VRWLPRVRRARLLRHPERARDELPRRCVRRPRVRRWLRAQRCEHRLRGRLDVSSRRALKVEKVEPVAGRRGVKEANEEATRRAPRSGCARFGVLFVSFPLALSSRTQYCIATRSRYVPSLRHLEESWERTYGPRAGALLRQGDSRRLTAQCPQVDYEQRGWPGVEKAQAERGPAAASQRLSAQVRPALTSRTATSWSSGLVESTQAPSNTLSLASRAGPTPGAASHLLLLPSLRPRTAQHVGHHDADRRRVEEADLLLL